MPLAGKELEQAQRIIKNLQSSKYQDKNYLFLKPFDISQVPGYFDIVTKAVDLQTVHENLNRGSVYDSFDDFWTDVKLVFENAIAYHTGRDTNAIATLAKEMLKVCNRERKNAVAERKPSLKIKMTPTLPTKSDTTTKKVKIAGTKRDSASMAELPQQDAPKKKKLSLKLKLAPTSATAGSTTENASATASSPAIPVVAQSTKSSSSEKSTKSPSSTSKLKIKMSIGSGGTKKVKKAKKDGNTSKKSADAQPEVVKAAASDASKSTSKANTDDDSKNVVKINPVPANRGKELPKAVAAAAAKKKKAAAAEKTKKKKSTTTTKGSSSSTATAAAGKTESTAASTKADASGMTVARERQCHKVLLGLKRRHNKQMGPFLQPVSDKHILKDYRDKIRYPMDISTMTSKLEKGKYDSLASFALDARRIFSNCLQYNYNADDKLRPVAIEVLQTVENLLTVFVARPEHPTSVYPPLLYCWRMCLQVLDAVFLLKEPSNGQPTAFIFLFPVSVYCGGQFPPGYKEKISRPMDFSTVTANLLEGVYNTVDAFCADCKLITTNCLTYYSNRSDDEVKMYMDQATRLGECLDQQIEQLMQYHKSPKATIERVKYNSRVSDAKLIQQPPVSFLSGIIKDLRSLKYTDKATKIVEPAMTYFESPVSLVDNPDYIQFVKEPMDLATIERKTTAGVYSTPEDFEYDVNLLFRNCEAYNAPRHNDHLVAVAKYGARQFKRIFHLKMRAIEEPSAPASSSSLPVIKASSKKGEEKRSEGKKMSVSAISDTASVSSKASKPPSKKIKIEASAKSSSAAPSSSKSSKATPRISITGSTSLPTAAKSKATKVVSNSLPLVRKTNSLPKVKPGQPVPLHIAIARVKENFPLRRAIKNLQVWEQDCYRYFKDLIKHPWLSTNRPKFIFHVPVSDLFPVLSEAYAAKVQRPMDLTTVECTLLEGQRYGKPQDFIEEVSLVFANAIRFNKDGRDTGDPISCAYYDASIHLLKYSRWLSMELLSDYTTSSERVDEPSADGLPPFTWQLTLGNKKKSREEMEGIVLNEEVERSLEGDRFTWYESECEKLLKALRHQSDVKHMTYFIESNYPADYTAFISTPMDWEKVNRKLKKRQYAKYGDIISDLRLIFSNAFKYNERLKDTNAVSGRAYVAAQHMSNKLEIAISKFILTVSERLERERIDHNNAERELEAADKAEEAAVRASWKKESEKDNSTAVEENKAKPATMPMRASASDAAAVQKIRMIRRAAQQRVEKTDFEIPFFDEEDNGKHERSYFEVIKFQKNMFEKQRQEAVKMKQTALVVGATMFTRYIQRQYADEWLQKELPPPDEATEKPKEEKQELAKPNQQQQPSNVLQQLEKEGRSPVKLLLAAPPKQKKRKAASMLKFSFDDM